MRNSNTPLWKDAQHVVADYLREYGFSIKQEAHLKSGKRIDIVAIKKLNKKILHTLIEVKDWNKVSRKNESDFCKQLIQYLIEYGIEQTSNLDVEEKKNALHKQRDDYYIGILCLTKDAHFSYRKVSSHFFKKNQYVLGIPQREQFIKKMNLFVARVDFIPKVFQAMKIPLYKESSITNWL